MESQLKVKLLTHTPEPDKIVAEAAKLCYSPVGVDEIEKNLDDEKIANFVNHLVSIGHESPIEHVSFTFAIEGISRTCSHQIVRHRIASFSQQSQRYVKLDQFEYIVPPSIAKYPKLKQQFIKHMEDSQRAYDSLVDELMYNTFFEKYRDKFEQIVAELQDGIESGKYLIDTQELDILRCKYPKLYSKIEKGCIEDARYVFPNACETKMVFTINARSLYNFFRQRCCERAQWEIRQLADEMLKLVKEVAPVLFKNAGAPCVRGGCPEGTMSCGSPKSPRKE